MMYDFDSDTSEKIKNVKYNTVLLKIVFTIGNKNFIVTSDSFNCPFIRFFLYELSVEQKEKLRKYLIKVQQLKYIIKQEGYRCMY